MVLGDYNKNSFTHTNTHTILSPFSHTLIHPSPPTPLARIAALKRQIGGLVNHPAHCLRVRLKTGKEAGKIFRDDRTLRANMPGLCDGKEVMCGRIQVHFHVYSSTEKTLWKS